MCILYTYVKIMYVKIIIYICKNIYTYHTCTQVTFKGSMEKLIISR